MRFLAFIMMFIYLAFTAGVVINHHYCMNELDSTTLFEKAGDTCGRCGMHTDDSDGCCHDETTVLLSDEDQVKPPAPFFHFSLAKISERENGMDIHALRSEESLVFPALDPPPRPGTERYLRLRIIRI